MNKLPASYLFFFCLFSLCLLFRQNAIGQTYFKIVEESEVYYNQQISRFPNGDILIGDSFLGPLINGGENGKVVMARMDNCGNILWAYSYSFPSGYLEFRDFIISPTEEILAYGSYFKGLDDVFFLLKINGETGKGAIFRLYEPETTNGYFAYSLKVVDDQYMVYGFMASPDVGLIAYFDEAFIPLWAKRITPFEPNGAAIIAQDKSLVARSGKYLFKMDQAGEFAWTRVLNIPAVNGPVEAPSGYIFVGHQEGFSYFFKIDAEGQLLWQSDEFRAVESSGAMSLLTDGNILFTYNCPRETENKLCQIILSSTGQILEQRQLSIDQGTNSGLLAQSINDQNIITIAGNANAFVPDGAEIKDFLLQFSLDELTDNCMSWENFQETRPHSTDLAFEFEEMTADDFDLKMIERTPAVTDTFLYPISEICGKSIPPDLLLRDTILPCGEDWLVWLPGSDFSWVDGSTEDPRLIEIPGIYKARNDDCSDPVEIAFKLEKQDCGCPVYLPNAFSPNNDGINDTLSFFSNCKLDDIQMRVFNRFGGQIFHSNASDTFWDGNFRNQAAEIGVYIVMLQYQWINPEGVQKSEQLFQEITLLR